MKSKIYEPRLGDNRRRQRIHEAIDAMVAYHRARVVLTEQGAAALEDYHEQAGDVPRIADVIR